MEITGTEATSMLLSGRQLPRSETGSLKINGSLDLHGADLKRIDLSRVTVTEGIDLTRVTVRGDVTFSDSVIRGDVMMNSIRIHGHLEFLNAILGNLKIPYAHIGEKLSLTNASINGLELCGVRIDGSLILPGVKICGLLNMVNLRAESIVVDERVAQIFHMSVPHIPIISAWSELAKTIWLKSNQSSKDEA